MKWQNESSKGTKKKMKQNIVTNKKALWRKQTKSKGKDEGKRKYWLHCDKTNRTTKKDEETLKENHRLVMTDNAEYGYKYKTTSKRLGTKLRW